MGQPLYDKQWAEAVWSVAINNLKVGEPWGGDDRVELTIPVFVGSVGCRIIERDAGAVGSARHRQEHALHLRAEFAALRGLGRKGIDPIEKGCDVTGPATTSSHSY